MGVRPNEEKVIPGDIFLQPDICVYDPTWSHKYLSVLLKEAYYRLSLPQEHN